MEEGDSGGDGTDLPPTVVMGSVDRIGGHDAFVIANTSCDDQWLRMPQVEAPRLRDWR